MLVLYLSTHYFIICFLNQDFTYSCFLKAGFLADSHDPQALLLVLMKKNNNPELGSTCCFLHVPGKMPLKTVALSIAVYQDLFLWASVT